MKTDPSRVIELAHHALNCATPSTLHRLESQFRLGPLDQTVLLYVPIPVVFIYQGSFIKEIIQLERLRLALERLLDLYPHLTGRIVLDPHTSVPNIDRFDAGALLVSAECDMPLSAFYSPSTIIAPDTFTSSVRLLGTDLPDGGNALLPPFDASVDGICTNPLLTVQHTHFADGSVALGVRIPHVVCDGAGFFQLINDMAEIYRGLDGMEEGHTVPLRHPPHIYSLLADLEQTEEERRTALAFKPLWLEFEKPPLDSSTSSSPMTNTTEDIASREVTESPSSSSSSSPPAPLPSPSASLPLPPPPVVGRVLRFSAQEVQALKQEANAMQADDAATQQPVISTYASMAAHLWQSVYRARVHHVASSLSIPVTQAATYLSHDFLHSANMRTLMEVPDRYFPNCVFCPYFTLSHDELADGPLGTVAAAVARVTRMMTPDNAVQTMHWLKAAQAEGQRTKIGFQWYGGGFMLSQWTRFDMYRGAVFDDNTPPVLVSQPFTSINKIDGLAYLLPTEQQGGGGGGEGGITDVLSSSGGDIDVYMSLIEPLWYILEQDARFRRHRK